MIFSAVLPDVFVLQWGRDLTVTDRLADYLMVYRLNGALQWGRDLTVTDS